MADQKISQLTELLTSASDDVLPIVTGGATKKIQLSNLSGGLGTAFATTACLNTTNASVAANSASITAISASAASALVTGIEFIMDGGGATIASGFKGYFEIPFSCSLQRATLVTGSGAGVSTCMVLDIWDGTFAAPPSSSANSIVGSSPLTIVAGSGVQDTTLTGWATSILAGHFIGWYVRSCTSAQRAVASIKVVKR